MINTWEQFGYNAGLVWDFINNYGSLTKKQLLDLTHLRSYEIHISIGWLARENKVSRDKNECFKLDNTNIGNEIGTHAGRVWKILDIWDDVDLESIKKLADLDDTQIHSALGWLAREDKITIDEKNRFKLK